MTPKEKAKELVEKFRMNQLDRSLIYNVSKQCALIAVDEILKVSLSYAGKDYDFYQEVKQEINEIH